MTRDQVETLTRLAEDIGFAMATIEAMLTSKGASGEGCQQSLDRLKASHAAITEVFMGEAA